MGETLGGVEVVLRPGKEGLGAAYRHGFRHALDAGYDPVLQMDADFSHDPAVLPDLLDAVAGGAEVAVGSRYVPGGVGPELDLAPPTALTLGQPVRAEHAAPGVP